MFGRAKYKGEISTPVIEIFREMRNSLVTVGTSAVAVPTTSLTGRKALIIQNQHASNSIYVGSCRPDIIKASTSWLQENRPEGTLKKINWTKSASGTNEYYATAQGGGDPGLSEALRMYGITSDGGSFGLLTNGTLGSLNNLEWDWGNNDTLGFNTIYFRFNTGDPDAAAYDYLTLLSFTAVPTGSGAATDGLKVTAGNTTPLMCLDSGVIVFVVASGSDTPAVAVEFA